MAKQKTIAIIHFNTPELTEALIKSIRKHGGEEYKVVIFDNSDERPFTKKMKGVKVFKTEKVRSSTLRRSWRSTLSATRR